MKSNIRNKKRKKVDEQVQKLRTESKALTDSSHLASEQAKQLQMDHKQVEELKNKAQHDTKEKEKIAAERKKK